MESWDKTKVGITCIVVRRNQRILQKVEDVIPAFYQTVFETLKLFLKFFQILFEQSVKPFDPRFFFDTLVRPCIPFVDCLLQKFFNFSGPLLCCVEFVQVLQLSKYMRKTNLMVQEVQGKIGTMAICWNCEEPLFGLI